MSESGLTFKVGLHLKLDISKDLALEKQGVDYLQTFKKKDSKVYSLRS